MRYSAYDLELLAVYSTIIKFRHILEGWKFRIYTDQKPLMGAFFKARDPVSNRQRQQLTFISEFPTDVAHIPNLENVVPDAFSRQYDDEEQPAVVHSVVHALTDVDLKEIARAQQPISEEPDTSLELLMVNFPGVDVSVVCDISLGRPRVLVPESRRREVFEAVHSLAHPSGRATLKMVARAYVWSSMRRDVLRWTRQCPACTASGREALQAGHVPADRFTHVHVDIVGPFSPDNGHRYLLTMIDRTTRWPEAVPIADTTADTVVRAFLAGWVAHFGIPVTVTTDRGAQFTLEAW